jgi:hypothetical protein
MAIFVQVEFIGFAFRYSFALHAQISNAVENGEIAGQGIARTGCQHRFQVMRVSRIELPY